VRTARSWAGWIATPAILGTYLLMTTGLISMRAFFCLSLVNSALMWFHTWQVQTRPMLLMSAAFYVMNVVGFVRTLR
jgi:hypothetical protein